MKFKTYSTFLFLEDGQFCQGWSCLNSIKSFGEVVFNTGMTGYQEIMTDPSYCDQIVLFTYPEIGNTGINIFDVESESFYIKGLVAKNICFYSSNWRKQISLIKYLVKYNIPHIFGVDTRYLAKYLRSKGVMIGCIASQRLTYKLLRNQIGKFKTCHNMHMVDRVTTCKSYQWFSLLTRFTDYYANNSLRSKIKDLHVIVIDYGVKFNILNRLIYYGCKITVVPSNTTYKSIILKRPDGVLLSNGPGDPALLSYALPTIKKLVSINMPVFGICLGHQLLSLVFGAQTCKLKFGHRGLNHPSKVCNTNTVTMTSQNHGYVVSLNSILSENVSIVCFNLNDNTVAGIIHKYKPCFSVQYHPEASPGPHDSDYLFKHFVKVMLVCKSKKKK